MRDRVYVICDKAQANRPEEVFASQAAALARAREMGVQFAHEPCHEFVVVTFVRAGTREVRP